MDKELYVLIYSNGQPVLESSQVNTRYGRIISTYAISNHKANSSIRYRLRSLVNKPRYIWDIINYNSNVATVKWDDFILNVKPTPVYTKRVDPSPKSTQLSFPSLVHMTPPN